MASKNRVPYSWFTVYHVICPRNLTFRVDSYAIGNQETVKMFITWITSGVVIVGQTGINKRINTTGSKNYIFYCTLKLLGVWIYNQSYIQSFYNLNNIYIYCNLLIMSKSILSMDYRIVHIVYWIKTVTIMQCLQCLN